MKECCLRLEQSYAQGHMDANTFGFNHLVMAIDKSQLSGDIQKPGTMSDDSTGKDHQVVIRSSGVKRRVGPRHSFS